jgi:hypothetical protein
LLVGAINSTSAAATRWFFITAVEGIGQHLIGSQAADLGIGNGVNHSAWASLSQTV